MSLCWVEWIYCEDCGKEKPCIRTLYLDIVLGMGYKASVDEIRNYSKNFLNNTKIDCIHHHNKKCNWNLISYHDIPKLLNNSTIINKPHIDKKKNNKGSGRFSDLEVVPYERHK